MSALLIPIATFLGSVLTFFSGFGLGTILLPVFLFFLPAELAIAATALVHFANSIVKFFFVRQGIHWPIALKFGIPAVIFAFLGGELLKEIGNSGIFYSIQYTHRVAEVSYLKAILGFLLLFFAWMDYFDRFSIQKSSDRILVFGGVLSGFFGGLSGHQGAFRSLFLSKVTIDKIQFVGTSNVISLAIDFTRIVTYLSFIRQLDFAWNQAGGMIVTGISAAILGVVVGMKLLHKTTIQHIQKIVALFLCVYGLLMLLGLDK